MVYYLLDTLPTSVIGNNGRSLARDDVAGRRTRLFPVRHPAKSAGETVFIDGYKSRLFDDCTMNWGLVLVLYF